MEFEKKAFPVKDLVAAFKQGSLTRNSEYQRGEAWTLPQKQALVDSLFRKYPIPPLFLELKKSTGLTGGTSEKFEIIDGQQRLLALTEFVSDNFELLSSDDKKLKLPVSLRPAPIAWSRRRYSTLDSVDRTRFDEIEVDVYMVSEVGHADEVRDLFIRLQSGTALTRQQIRDAWPGNLGPFIEAIAGKLQKKPRYTFFQMVDGRGLRDEEGDSKDPYVKHRQTCAQLFRILLERISDGTAFSTITASDLDGLYHTYTDIDINGELLGKVVRVFDGMESVCQEISRIFVRVYKIHKQQLFSLACFFLDSYKNPNFKMDSKSIKELANFVINSAPKQRGKSSNAADNRNYYDHWRELMPESIGIIKDARRLFSNEQRAKLYEIANGKCQLCGDEISLEEGEADHFPIPHRDGGLTELENGRFVCIPCHPRGLPKSVIMPLEPDTTEIK